VINLKCARFALLVVAGFAAFPVFSQSFPSKPIRLVVTFPPGGGTDAIARLLSVPLSESMGQQVVVDNRPGASGNIGAEIVAKAPADGYTWLIVNSTYAMNAGLFPNMPFDSEKDLTGVATIASTPIMLVVPASSSAKGVSDLIALAKAKPGQLSYASCGNGTPQHLGGELFKRMAGIDMVHVPYKGCAPALQDGLAGRIDALFNTVPNTVPHHKAGRLRAIGVGSKKRTTGAPDVPSMNESVPGFDVDQWYVILVPSGTPREVLQRINREIDRAVARPDIKDRLIAQSFDPLSIPLDEVQPLIRNDIARWSKLIRELGVKVD
jgi:tripartite-type tricarboxylate transporter receptor subunit TctC